MRLISVCLVVLGVVVGVGLPLRGAGRLALFAGAACLLVAAVLAARERSGWARAGFAGAGIVAAVVLLLAPGVVNGTRNGRGIAWAVPDGERVLLAEQGLAVTRDQDGALLTGRNLDTGERRWQHRLRDPTYLGAQLSVQRIGRTLIVHDRDGAFSGLDPSNGAERWNVPGIRTTQAVVATPDVFAFIRCDERGSNCQAEARSVADGALRWRAPALEADGFLGAPHTARGNLERLPVWPASIALLRQLPDGDRYEVRELATGRVVARGNAEGESAVVTVDARSGKAREIPNRLDRTVEIVATDAPGVPVFFTSYLKDGVQADGRVYRTPALQRDSIAATATQVGWESEQPAFASADQDGAEVHDRRTGRRLVRYTGDDVDIRSVGERLIITDDDRDYVVAPTAVT